MLLCFIISLKVFQRFSQHMSWERYIFFPMRLNSTLLLLYMAHKYNDSLGMVRYHNHSTTSIQLFQISTSIPSINIRIMDDVITFNICVHYSKCHQPNGNLSRLLFRYIFHCCSCDYWIHGEFQVNIIVKWFDIKTEFEYIYCTTMKSAPWINRMPLGNVWYCCCHSYLIVLWDSGIHLFKVVRKLITFLHWVMAR